MGGFCSKKFCRFCSRNSVNQSVREGNFPSSVVSQIRDEYRKMENHLNIPSVIASVDNKDGQQFVTGNSALSDDPKISADKILNDLDRARKPRMSSGSPHKPNTKVEVVQLSGKVEETDEVLHSKDGKLVLTLDKIDSDLTNFSCSSSFNGEVDTTSDNVSILAFEVANTIVRGCKLMKSLSQENMRYLKENVLQSEGVRLLISEDMDELFRIVASDKREELNFFSGEVVRFGNRCKDSRWHNLDHFFDKIESELKPAEELKETADSIIQQLMDMAQYTAELYQKLQAIDKLEKDYQRMFEDENASLREDNLQQLRKELKHQRKLVNVLRSKSLWSEVLEKVVEKLVDVVHFLHLQIHEAFESGDAVKPVKELTCSHQRLGSAGLALHYANIIIQINTIASRSTSIVPKSVRDMLYQSLPSNTKSALRKKLQSFHISQELSVSEIKLEMDKTLFWLVPIARSTIKAHQGFGWVGEWANTGSEANQKSQGQMYPNRIDTFYHASKEMIEFYILELVALLHHLISHTISTDRDSRSPIKSPTRPSTLSTSTSALPPVFNF